MADLLKFMHCWCTYTFWNAKWLPEEAFWDWSDWDCTVCYDAETVWNVFWEAKEYNFDNLTICEWVKLRFCWQWVPIIRVKNCFINEWEINLRAPLLNIWQTIEEKYTWKEISSYKNDCYDIALAHYNTMVSCCETLKSCLTLENLSGVRASWWASGQTCAGWFWWAWWVGWWWTQLNWWAWCNWYAGYSISSNWWAAWTSSYENAWWWWGWWWFWAVYWSKTMVNEAQAWGNAWDWIWWKWWNWATVILIDNSRYTDSTLCHAGAWAWWGWWWWYCQWGDWWDWWNITACCCTNKACKSWNWWNWWNSYLWKAWKWWSSWWSTTTSNCPGKWWNWWCSYYWDWWDAWYTIYWSSIKWWCSIYWKWWSVNWWYIASWYWWDSVYWNWWYASSNCGSVYWWNSYYWNWWGVYAYSGRPGCSVYWNWWDSSSCCHSYTNNWWHSIYWKGWATCNASSYYWWNWIEWWINCYWTWADWVTTRYWIAWWWVYWLWLFANSLNNEWCIYWRWWCWRICSRWAEIIIWYKTLLCNTGWISYEWCATACNWKLTVMQW